MGDFCSWFWCMQCAMCQVNFCFTFRVSHSTVCTASNLKSQDIAQEGLPIFRLDISADAVCHFAQPFWRETAESFRGAKVLLYSAHSCMNFS